MSRGRAVSLIADNLSSVRQRIADAASSCGRPADAVTLVAVTKYVGAAEIEELVAAGARDLGESRPQSLWEKAEQLEPSHDVQWHLVGHLQRNKVRRTLPLVALIHSVDSARLLKTLDDEAALTGATARVLLEVNVSGDRAKHGLAPDVLPELLESLPRFPHVEVRGLMTMASQAGGRDTARRNFAALRDLRDRAQGNAPDGVTLEELSMGMSGDLEEAIAEGSTLVRIGSALFEGIAR